MCGTFYRQLGWTHTALSFATIEQSNTCRERVRERVSAWALRNWVHFRLNYLNQLIMHLPIQIADEKRRLGCCDGNVSAFAVPRTLGTIRGWLSALLLNCQIIMKYSVDAISFSNMNIFNTKWRKSFAASRCVLISSGYSMFFPTNVWFISSTRIKITNSEFVAGRYGMKFQIIIYNLEYSRYSMCTDVLRILVITYHTTARKC